jgi:hypothetical protein
MADKKTCSCCPQGEKTREAKCPVCGTLCPAVSRVTVAAILQNTVELPENAAFNICAAPDCKVSYFSAGKYWTLEDASVPFDFKTGASTRYACYCNGLTYEETAKIEAETGDTDWGRVVKAAKGAIRPCKCAEKNPLGVCCSSNSFVRAVKEAKNRRKAK